MGSQFAKHSGVTHFAPAGRADEATVRDSIQRVAASPIMTELLEAVGGTILILNPERQIVASNTTAAEALGIEAVEWEAAMGLRPGEALGCTISKDTPSGCGTALACAACGAAKAIVEAQARSTAIEHECILRLARLEGELSREFRVRASPIVIDSSPFVLFVMHDISDKKRKENLERTFLHDLSSTLGALQTYQALLAESSEQSLDDKTPDGKTPGDPAQGKLVERMGQVVARIVDEVKSHRDLWRSESDTLAVRLELCDTQEVLDTLSVCFREEEPHGQPELRFTRFSTTLRTDRTLLLRVLTNMLKNAIEASRERDVVMVGCSETEQHVIFSVTNPGEIASEVAARIFTRSFSTKGGLGRGVGTYSMKLFGERYLGGRLSFESGQGTTRFVLCLPKTEGGNATSLTRLRVF